MAFDPTGRIVRNLFLLRRLENLIGRQAAARIAQLFADIVAATARLDPTSVEAKRYVRGRITRLLPEIETLSNEALAEIHKEVRTALARVAKQQSIWAAATLDEVLGELLVTVAPGRLGINKAKVLLDTDPIAGELIKDAFADVAENVKRGVRRQIQLGVAADETLDDIVRRIRGRSIGRGRYVGGVMQTTTRQAEGIVRTALTDIAAQAHLATYRANPDITDRYKYVATLDGRTTPICRSLDLNVYRYDDPAAKRPPQHWRCRSTVVPIIDWEGLGIPEPPESTRASAGGQVPSSTTYEQWLRDQPTSVQNEILGPTRANLFRGRKVTLKDLVDSDGRTIRLDELEAA